MRPIRLELEGFASFREHTVIEFGDVDQFVLFGPTGAGKSSILDGIAFALYGSVPRYNDTRLVAPVITQGSAEAKVLLEFSVGDKRYKAARVVRRQKDGSASTKEAKWECGGANIGVAVDELTGKVEEAVGLTFEQFTKCVLLPQGEFAKFLQDKPKDRQNLLKRLLDMGRFEAIARRAEQKYTGVKDAQTRIEGRLEDYADATEANLKEKAKRTASVEKVKAEVDSRWKEIAQLQLHSAALKSKLEEFCQQVSKLEAISKPEGLDELASRQEGLRKEFEAAAKEVQTANQAVSQAQSEIEAKPSRASLEKLLELYGRNEESAITLKSAQEDYAAALAKQSEAERSRKGAALVRDGAYEVLQAAELAHQAHAVAAKLKPGDPCPVCGSKFSAMPGGASGSIAQAKADFQVAESALAAADMALQRANTTAAVAERQLGNVREDAAKTTALLEGQQSRETASKSLEELQMLEGKHKAARDDLAGASRRQDAAQRALAALENELKDAWGKLGRARDSLSALTPPALSRDDLKLAWTQLLTWTGSTVLDIGSKAEETGKLALQAEKERKEAEGSLDEFLVEHEIKRGADDAPTACIKLLERLGVEHEQLKERIEVARKLREDLSEAKMQTKLFGALRTHLRANNFESWYLNRSFAKLTEIASIILMELTGRYSLTVDESNDFQIVDHSNASEMRSVRTLSGGETFLASLALALALSDQVAGTGARLESLFIDEGFGSLDTETLEAVSSAIDELRSRGRMIGVITHVHDFAERMPVRFNVTRSPSGSTVERVSA